ncbi:hypothetical protein AGMMS49975_19090 [Clostridia bacterium]|nr:hypothetical protein AGMMS49975_19090 [Clostridia bacterium]
MNAVSGLTNEINRVTELSFYKLGSIGGVADPAPDTNIFEGMVQAAMQTIEDTNNNQLAAEQKYVDLATGRTNDYLAVVMAQQQASVSLNFTVQVTSKILDAYREIMRMQL